MTAQGSVTLLVDERVIPVGPRLVQRLGLTQAYVLQQVHWHLQTGQSHEHDGHTWAPVTYTVLAAETGLTPQQVRRSIEQLEEAEILLSCQPESFNRRKSYRVNLMHPKITAPWGESAPRAGETARIPTGESAPSTSSQRSSGSATGKRPRARGPRDDLFDALVLGFGPASTPARAAFYGKTVRELMAAGATPELVQKARIVMSRRGWDHPTPEALVKHWDELIAEEAGPTNPAARRFWESESA